MIGLLNLFLCTPDRFLSFSAGTDGVAHKTLLKFKFV